MEMSELRRSPFGTTAAIRLADEEELDRAAGAAARVAVPVRETRVFGGIITIRGDGNQMIHSGGPGMRRLQFPTHLLAAEVATPLVPLAYFFEGEAVGMLGAAPARVLDPVVIAIPLRLALDAEFLGVLRHDRFAAARARYFALGHTLAGSGPAEFDAAKLGTGLPVPSLCSR